MRRRLVPNLLRLCALGWLVTALALGTPASAAAPEVSVSPGMQVLGLSEQLQYLPDPQQRWTPGNLPPADAPWQSLSEHAGGGNFGHVKYPVWFRVSLRSGFDRPTDWRWVVDHPLLSSIDLLVLDGSERPPALQQAGLVAHAEGAAPLQRVAALPLSLPAHASLQVVMRVASTGILRVPVSLHAEAAWADHDRWLHMVLGGYFGLIVGLVAYNGVLWARLRDASYGHYVGFGLGMVVYQLGGTGLGTVYVWPQWAVHSALIVVLAASWFAAFGLLFTDQFLRLRDVAPRLSLALRGSALLWVPATLLLFEVSAGDFIRWVLLPLAMWGVSLVVVAGVVGVHQKVPAALIFLIGWSAMAAAAVVRAVLVQGWVSTGSLLYHALLIATALEMVLLSFALADRIRLERRARSAAELSGARERTARELAQQALQERSRFMAAVTHDLQQPLYALRMVWHTLQRQRGTAPEAETLAQLSSAVHATNDLTTSMLMAVQMHRDELTPDLHAFSVQPMLERIEAMFSARAQERRLRWVVTPCLSSVHTDPVLLERMVSNLVSNALRYTPRGGVLLSCRERAGQLLIQVWDTGPGIEPDEQAALLEPFRRGRTAEQRDHGMGLGLSIVSHCARLLGIRLGLRTVPGRGSCFSLWVPLSSSKKTASA